MRIAAPGRSADPSRVRRDVRQHPAALAKAHEVDGVQRVAILRIGEAGRHQKDLDGAFTALQRDGPEQRGVDGREQRGIDADNERERADAGGRVRGSTSKRAEGLA